MIIIWNTGLHVQVIKLLLLLLFYKRYARKWLKFDYKCWYPTYITLPKYAILRNYWYPMRHAKFHGLKCWSKPFMKLCTLNHVYIMREPAKQRANGKSCHINELNTQENMYILLDCRCWLQFQFLVIPFWSVTIHSLQTLWKYILIHVWIKSVDTYRTISPLVN